MVMVVRPLRAASRACCTACSVSLSRALVARRARGHAGRAGACVRSPVAVSRHPRSGVRGRRRRCRSRPAAKRSGRGCARRGPRPRSRRRPRPASRSAGSPGRSRGGGRSPARPRRPVRRDRRAACRAGRRRRCSRVPRPGRTVVRRASRAWSCPSRSRRRARPAFLPGRRGRSRRARCGALLRSGSSRSRTAPGRRRSPGRRAPDRAGRRCRREGRGIRRCG